MKSSLKKIKQGESTIEFSAGVGVVGPKKLKPSNKLQTPNFNQTLKIILLTFLPTNNTHDDNKG